MAKSDYRRRNGFKWQSCGGKIGYNTWAEAKKAIKKTLRRGNSRAAGSDKSSGLEQDLEPYTCPFCKYIHIGHGLRSYTASGRNLVIPASSALKPAVIFDIDSTIACPKHRLDRLPDWSQFFEAMHLDPPITPVIKTLLALLSAGNHIILVTGRPDQYRNKTVEWLEAQNIQAYRLFMRPLGDKRPNHEVKSDILDQILAEGYSVFLAFDDRAKDAQMYRSRGIVCLQNEPSEEEPTKEEALKIS
jgi:hypothetical protein